MNDNSTQVYHVFIRATAEDIWQALVSPERTAQYFYATAIEVTTFSPARTLPATAKSSPSTWPRHGRA